MTSEAGRVIVGQRDWVYEVKPDWLRRPVGCSWLEVAAVATDSSDNLFVFNRGPHPVMVFDRGGIFLYSWGQGIFARPHGITIGPDDAVYCTDDCDHTVRKFTPDGQLLLTLGTSEKTSDTGATSNDYRTIRRSAGPFHFPTNLALAPEGEMYVTDGYGNARVHKFSPKGELLFSWGSAGAGPGEFRIPHGIAVDRNGHVFVADRENSRIQIFSPTGDFLDEWRGVARPAEVAFDTLGNLFVAELGYRAGMWAGTNPPTPDATGGRLSIFTAGGTLLARWGGGDNPTSPGDFFAPHDLCIDSQGALYVAEVVMSSGGDRGLVSPDCHSLQKFAFCGAQRKSTQTIVAGLAEAGRRTSTGVSDPGYKMH